MLAHPLLIVARFDHVCDMDHKTPKNIAVIVPSLSSPGPYICRYSLPPGLFAMPLSLSQPQFLAIANAAAALFPSDRDPFLAAVAAALEGQPIGDGILGRIIRDVQCRFDHPEPEPVPARWERDKPRFERTSKRAF